MIDRQSSPAPSRVIPEIAVTDPARVVDELTGEDQLTPAEVGYVQAARAANTMRGYQSDWREFTTWCAHAGRDPLPATASTVTAYLSELAAAGAKVGTMSRRLSALKFVHAGRGLPDPTRNARVMTVWEGIRRTHATPPAQAAPLMPPLLFDVLDACPTTKTWKNPARSAEPSLAGARDRALLLVGFIAALRRSELAGIQVRHLADHPNGLVITLPRSKTNQTGTTSELVVLPRGTRTNRCPVTAIRTWLDLAQITTPEAPVFQGVTNGNTPTGKPLNHESINTLIQQAIARTGENPASYSAHSLRAGFITYAHLRGASDRAIAHQTRHRSLATIGTYIRLETAWEDNAATRLGL